MLSFMCLIPILSFRTPAAKPISNYFLQTQPTIQLVAEDVYRQFLSSHKILTQGLSSEAEVMSRISSRIIQAVKAHYQGKKTSHELLGFQWEINLIAEKKIDAWCLPGGKIAVYSSLFPLTQSDESMAVVLAHVIAHALLQHGDPRMKNYLTSYFRGKDISAAYAEKPNETKDFFKMAYGNGDYVGVIKAFSDADEMEADKLATIFMDLAGYNPIEAIVFWERIVSS